MTANTIWCFNRIALKIKDGNNTYIEIALNEL